MLRELLEAKPSIYSTSSPKSSNTGHTSGYSSALETEMSLNSVNTTITDRGIVQDVGIMYDHRQYSYGSPWHQQKDTPPSRRSYYKCFEEMNLSTVSEESTSGTCRDNPGNEIASLNPNPTTLKVASPSKVRPIITHDPVVEEGVEVIHRLKRRSSAWSGLKVRRSETVTARLREGVENAKRKQEGIESFLTEASSQLHIQQQAHAALLMCKESASPEGIEAERLILLAGERHKTFRQAAQNEVFKLCGASIAPLESATLEQQPCTATIFLSDIFVHLTSTFHSEVGSGWGTHHFLVLVREEKTQGITATHTISISRQNSPHVLEFSNRFTLPEIPHDLDISLELYHMYLQPPCKTKAKNRPQVFKAVHARGKSLRRYKPYCLMCAQNPSTASVQGDLAGKERLFQSSFKLLGKISILDDSNLGQKDYPLQQVQSATSNCVAEKIGVSAFAELNYDSLIHPLEGYLSLYNGHWQRRWFALQGSSLCYWLYPDQPENNEKPKSEWDLSICTEPARPARSDVCGWQDSFVIPLSHSQEPDKLLLSADTTQERLKWVEAINHIVYSTIAWKRSGLSVA